MSAGIKIDYDAMNSIIDSINVIATDGKTEAQGVIDGLEDMFLGSNSCTTDLMKSIKVEYTQVNDLLTELALNSSVLLEKAKTLYQETDRDGAESIAES